METIGFHQLSKRMMEDCSSVAEALDVLRSVEAVSQAFFILLADALGDLAHVELGSHGFELHESFSRLNPGVVMAVNCYQSRLKSFNDPKAALSVCENNNGCRLWRGKQLAALFKGQIDVQVMRRILSDHENRDKSCSENPLIKWWGYSICHSPNIELFRCRGNHGTRQQDAYQAAEPCWGTVSAEVLQPSQRHLE